MYRRRILCTLFGASDFLIDPTKGLYGGVGDRVRNVTLHTAGAETHVNKITNVPVFLVLLQNVHRKNRFTSFPSPAGMSLTKLPLGRNNSVMTSLFPPRESLVVTSRLGTGTSRSFFLRCSITSLKHNCY